LRKKDFQRAIYEEKKPLVPKEIVDQKSVTELAPTIYSHEKVGKGFEGDIKILVGDLSIPLIVGARPILGYKVGFKDVEGLALEHRSSSHIQEALKETVNTCENDVVKLNLSSSCSFPFNNLLGGVEGLGPAPFVLIKRPRGQPPKTTKTPLCSNIPLVNLSDDFDPCDREGPGSMEGLGSFSSDVQS
jgi:hypothetical protein